MPKKLSNNSKKIGDILKTKKFWVELLIMTFGMFFVAISVHFFLVPSKLIVGSISGLSIVINILTGIPVSLVSFIINLILLILAYLLIGKEFGTKTVYTALMLSPWLYLLEQITTPEILGNVFEFDSNGKLLSIMGDPWFDLLCFVVILSATQAILFKINASTGGLDILAKIVNKYLHINIGTSVSIAGAIICLTAIFINPIRLVIIGLLGTWINGLVLNHFSTGLSSKKKVCIVSKKHQIIKDFILNDIHRGVTLYEVTGGYSGEKSTELQVLVDREEFDKLMQFINNQNIDAFITAGNVSEVYGLWNKQKKKPRTKIL
ncbi:MAG: YitT family protein [Bacteroidales bacterium]|jgi:uncharacterized membrane-anchored protein YitT (DUF2179 family)